MLSDFLSLSGIEKTTFVIAVLGFLFSCVHGLTAICKNLEKYKISVIDYRKFTPKTVTFFLCVTNRSSSTLTLTAVKFCGVECELEPKKIKNHPSPEAFYWSAQFPVQIPPRQAQIFYIEFVDEHLRNIELNPGTAVNFQIRSTRRQARKSLLLGQPSHYLHSRCNNE